VKTSGTKPHLRSARSPRLNFVRGALFGLVLCFVTTPGLTQNLTITNFTGYVSVHYITIPNKANTLQGAWVYPTNVVRYTNLLWTNLGASWPPLPSANHLFYQDYSVTNRVTNRFRIYRVKT